jgi:predicted nucleic acid-binding protein
MYLVDTSVWVSYLREGPAGPLAELEVLLDNPLACGLSDQILMEILQGARDERAFRKLSRYFGGQRLYRFDDPTHSHTEAARLYLRCRRRGITVRSAMDCLVAQCALEHNLTLLHRDRDFDHINRVVPAFRQRSLA